MSKFTYEVLAFRQQEDSPIQVAFVAHARDVLRWAGVPRKSDELLTGFQRFRDNKRIDEQIVPFFQQPTNCSPTAIIVALLPNSGLGKCYLKKKNLLLKEEDIPAEKVIEAKLIIEIDEDAFKTDAIFEAASAYVTNRLQDDDTDQVDESDKNENEEPFIEEEMGDEFDSSDSSDEIAHLGTTTLHKMQDLLEDKKNWKRNEFREAIIDYVKPATVIDGQHRVSAAAKIGMNGLPFIICGLFDASWSEQVFQFTVVNLKPKRIPPSVITSIAGLSLTRNEQDLVERRLKQAGIDVAEVTIMSLVSYDEKSPFAEKVDLAIGGSKDREEKLGYGGMKRIAKEWYGANRNSLTLIAKEIYSTKSVQRARENWRDDRQWFDFFCIFWDSVHNHFPDDLWQKSPESRLFIGAHLWALQEVILSQADGQVADWWIIDDNDLSTEDRAKILKQKLLKVVSTTLNYFPDEMWRMQWKPSQDTNQGRADLVSLFNKFIDEGKKTGISWRNWKRDSWFNVS